MAPYSHLPDSVEFIDCKGRGGICQHFDGKHSRADLLSPRHENLNDTFTFFRQFKYSNANLRQMDLKIISFCFLPVGRCAASAARKTGIRAAQLAAEDVDQHVDDHHLGHGSADHRTRTLSQTDGQLQTPARSVDFPFPECNKFFFLKNSIEFDSTWL